MSQTTRYYHDSMTMKKKNVILQSIIWSVFRGARQESMTMYKAKVKCSEKNVHNFDHIQSKKDPLKLE